MWGSTLHDELPRAEAKASFSQTDPSPTAPNDQVVQHLDLEQLSGLDNLAGHGDSNSHFADNSFRTSRTDGKFARRKQPPPHPGARLLPKLCSCSPPLRHNENCCHGDVFISYMENHDAPCMLGV